MTKQQSRFRTAHLAIYNSKCDGHFDLKVFGPLYSAVDKDLQVESDFSTAFSLCPTPNLCYTGNICYFS